MGQPVSRSAAVLAPQADGRLRWEGLVDSGAWRWARFALGTGGFQRVDESVDDFGKDDPRFPLEAVADLCGAIALPAVHAGEVLGVLELYLCEPASADVTEGLDDTLTSIGGQVGSFLARRRGLLGPSVLTPREVEVLQLAAEGCDGREIAERLVVSPATVRTHFDHIYGKYGVSDRVAAVARALRDGLIE